MRRVVVVYQDGTQRAWRCISSALPRDSNVLTLRSAIDTDGNKWDSVSIPLYGVREILELERG